MPTFKTFTKSKSLIPELSLEIAETPQEQEVGLMYRKTLDENVGMLFVYPRPTLLSFWMKNTTIPLDVAFIDDAGIIGEIHELSPRSLEHVVSQVPYKYALEVNRMWFDKHGYAVGSRILRF